MRANKDISGIDSSQYDSLLYKHANKKNGGPDRAVKESSVVLAST